jgi:hypothetical protein
MASNLRVGQPVTTPKGPATFIAYFRDGFDCQVSRRVPAKELSKEEIVKRCSSMATASAEDFNRYRNTAVFVINEVYAEGEVHSINSIKVKIAQEATSS